MALVKNENGELIIQGSQHLSPEMFVALWIGLPLLAGVLLALGYKIFGKPL